MPTFSRSMVWKGFWAPSPPAPVLVYEPVTKGTFWPTVIYASWLSRVSRLGVDRILALVCSSSALRMTAMDRLSLTWPQPRVVPPVLARAPARLARLISLSLSSSGSTASAMLRARASEALILLPKAPLWSANNHWIPRSWPSITSISTMIASTSTWARRISRR